MKLKEGRWTRLNQGSLIEWEYPNNTRGKSMPEINSMKGNTLNKLKEGDARKQLKEGGCPAHTQGIRNTLKQTQEREMC